MLVSYGTEENQKKLEDYISEVTGHPVNLGPLGYDGAGTILIISYDLKKINRTNVTGAVWYPGRKFRRVDEFIEWHKNLKTVL